MKDEELEVINFDNNHNKKVKKKQNTGIVIVFIILDLLALTGLFLSYGPISYFRDMLITTSMTTMTHKYFARTLYDEQTINKVLNNNYVKEINEDTKASEIIFEEIEPKDEYESIYEEEILKKDKDNDLYKLIEIKGIGYNGYMVVIYDASRISLATSTKLSVGGQKLVDLLKSNDAILGINASGFSRSGKAIKPTGNVISKGKLISSGKGTGRRSVGGFIGFNKDNVLILTKESYSNAIKNGMVYGMEFGPFLIVNGKSSTVKGNGGWGIANRTAIAQRKDGIVLFLVIDGRSKNSLGIDMNGMVKIFTRYKAYNAANLDGGGSSTLVINGKLINDPRGYNYEGERYIPNAWILK